MNKFFCEGNQLINLISNSKIGAMATIHGREPYANISGEVLFYDFDKDTVVVCLLHNLPDTPTNFFGFHIHKEGSCEGDFSSAGPHFGEGNHPNHAGDLPVILNAGGNAFLAFCTNRFTVKDIIGKSVIIHSMPDDYRSQPSGDSGERIACGTIK